jgi:hypothetical protein
MNTASTFSAPSSSLQWVGFWYGWPLRYGSYAWRINKQAKSLDGLPYEAYRQAVIQQAQKPRWQSALAYVWYGNRSALLDYYEQRFLNTSVSQERLPRQASEVTRVIPFGLAPKPQATVTVAAADEVQHTRQKTQYELARLLNGYREIAKAWDEANPAQTQAHAQQADHQLLKAKRAVVTFMSRFSPKAYAHIHDLWQQFVPFNKAKLNEYRKPFFSQQAKEDAQKQQQQLKNLYTRISQQLARVYQDPQLSLEARQRWDQGLRVKAANAYHKCVGHYLPENWQVMDKAAIEKTFHEFVSIHQAGEEQLFMAIEDARQNRLALVALSQQTSTAPSPSPLAASDLRALWQQDKQASEIFLQEQARKLQEAAHQDGVKQAVQDALNSHYRQLAKRYHPDRNPNEAEVATEIFKELSEWLQVEGERLFQRDHRVYAQTAYSTEINVLLEELLKAYEKLIDVCQQHNELLRELINIYEEQREHERAYLKRVDVHIAYVDQQLIEISASTEAMIIENERQNRQLAAQAQKLDDMQVRLDNNARALAYLEQLADEQDLMDDTASSSPKGQRLKFFDQAEVSEIGTRFDEVASNEGDSPVIGQKL